MLPIHLYLCKSNLRNFRRSVTNIGNVGWFDLIFFSSELTHKRHDVSLCLLTYTIFLFIFWLASQTGIWKLHRIQSFKITMNKKKLLLNLCLNINCRSSKFSKRSSYSPITWTRQIAHVSHFTSQDHIATAFHFFKVNIFSPDFGVFLSWSTSMSSIIAKCLSDNTVFLKSRELLFF